MKVYIVTRLETEWQEIIAVYSSREKAQKVADSLTTYWPSMSKDEMVPREVGTVTEMTLDTAFYDKGE